jgi:uncharacterized membrane protein
MTKGRMETSKDGVLAVIVTIMVLETKAPHGTQRWAMQPLISVDAWPVALYGIVLLYAAIAYYILTRSLSAFMEKARCWRNPSEKAKKGKISIAVYAAAVPLAFV